jgi:CRISPR/Cas system-associated exonuclease Cas4 (RecB family)
MNNKILLFTIHPVSTLSPSGYYNFLSCRLRGILSANHFSRLLPLSPSIRLGSAIHKLFECAFKGMITNENELNLTWENIITNIEKEMINNRLESHLIPLASNTRYYEVKKAITLHAVQDMISNIKTGTKNAHFDSEKSFKTDDGKIVGRIDLIKKKDDYTEIIDFKTGEILEGHLENAKPKKEYEFQLKMYAALYFSVHQLWPDKLILTGLNQQNFEITYKPQECLTLLDQAKKELIDINERIDQGTKPEDFAQPSSDSCKYCFYRPGCDKYWNTREDANGWPFDALGEIKEKKRLGNGYYKVVISQNAREISVRGLSERHDFLINDVHKMLLCNLGKDTSIRNFIETPLTTGYVL